VRRIVLAILGAFFGTTVLIGLKSPAFFHTAGTVVGAPAEPGATDNPGADPSHGAPGQTSTPGSTGGPTGTPKPGQTKTPGPTTSGPQQSTTTTTKPPTSRTTTTTPSSATYTGMYVAVKTAQSPTTKSSPCGECHNYSMAVTITVSGGRITGTSVSYNTSPGSSQSYASRAVNSLSSKVLSSQTWNLGRVSGATYSGNAWELSVRDAMSKAGLPT
jgi:uncharacterized protein with FMN-binding domain